MSCCSSSSGAASPEGSIAPSQLAHALSASLSRGNITTRGPGVHEKAREIARHVACGRVSVFSRSLTQPARRTLLEEGADALGCIVRERCDGELRLQVVEGVLRSHLERSIEGIATEAHHERRLGSELVGNIVDGRVQDVDRHYSV